MTRVWRKQTGDTSWKEKPLPIPAVDDLHLYGRARRHLDRSKIDWSAMEDRARQDLAKAAVAIEQPRPKIPKKGFRQSPAAYSARMKKPSGR